MTEQRFASLDMIRGLAVMGILLMNIIAFGLPDAAYVNPLGWGNEGPVDRASWALGFLLIDGKMRGLFSILFGASMLLVYQGAEAKNGDGKRVHRNRMLWLFAFGLVHLYFIWRGDILASYALCGLLGMFLLTRDEAALKKTIGWFIGLSTFILFCFGASLQIMAHVARLPSASAVEKREFAELAAELGAGAPAKIAQEVLLYQSDYVAIFMDRLSKYWAMPFETLALYGLETLGFLALGMLLFRNGFLTGQWSMAAYRKTMFWCYGLGLVPLAALLGWCFAVDLDAITVTAITIGWATPFRILVTIGHAALAMIVIKKFGHTRLFLRIGAAGRAAFTNYLGTSIFMTLLFYGYGFGLFGMLSRSQCYLVAFAFCGVMLLWSKPWLDRYRYGPLEWLWRSLARGERQPMRRG